MEQYAFLQGLPESLIVQNTPETDAWKNNNSTFADYCECSGIPNAEGIIRNQLGRSAVGAALDIAGGSDGAALKDLLGDTVITRGLVTNYYDSRSLVTKATEALTHITGDILQSPTWEQIDTWQTGNTPEGFALIMHRPYGALQNLPASFYLGAVHALLDRLSPDGVLFVQIPQSLQKWYGGDLDSVCWDLRQRDDIDSIRTPVLVLPLSSALIIKRPLDL